MTTNDKLAKVSGLLQSKEFKAFLAIPADIRGKLAEYRALERAAIEAAVTYFKGNWGRDERKAALTAISAVPELASIAKRVVAGLFPAKPAKLDKAGQARMAGVMAALASASATFAEDELPALRAWLNSQVSKILKAAAEKAEKKAEK